MKAEIGSRVMAILSAKDGVVRVFGEGEYLGNQVPENLPHLELLHKAEIPSPAIKLDNGVVIYGAECWWGSVEKVKEKFAGWEFQVVPLSQYREVSVASGHGPDTQSL